MGKLIKAYFPNPKEEERKRNVAEITALIDKYIPERRKFVRDKIKKEQE